MWTHSIDQPPRLGRAERSGSSNPPTLDATTNQASDPSQTGFERAAWSEAALADAWEQRRYLAHWLVDCCGRHFRVVFPGRRWGGPGPDFVGAVLALRDGTLVRGDVEVHVRASGWAAHGHARDPVYQDVVLHVVGSGDAMALNAQGWHVPTLTLEPLRGAPARPVHAPCVRAAPAVLEVVREAGRARFRARAARFEGDLAVVDADQVVWRGVCEALGFQRNTRPFGQLAEAVPWSQAAHIVADRGPVGVAGVLLGAAGLVSEASLPEAHAWRAVQRALGVRPALSGASWDRRQLRRANSPVLRCRGLAELVARWAGGGRPGPAEQVLEAVRHASLERRPRLWPLVRASPWVGQGRAQVVVINVLLPFAAAAGVAEAADLFERLPGEPPNRVLRYMAEQLGSPRGEARAERVRFRGACLQQGLLHLFSATCASRICERCPARGAVGRRLVGAGATTRAAESS